MLPIWAVARLAVGRDGLHGADDPMHECTCRIASRLRKAGAFGDDAPSFGRVEEELLGSGVIRRVVVALGFGKAWKFGDGDHRFWASFDGSGVGIVDNHS